MLNGLIGEKAGWMRTIDPLTGKERFERPGGIEVPFAPGMQPSSTNPLSQVQPAAPAAPAKPLAPSSTSGVLSASTIPFDPGADLSMPVGEEFGGAVPKSDVATELAKQSQEHKQATLALAGANFMLGVLNSQSAYRAAQGQAQLNILQARNQASDALYRGRQARLDAESEGYNVGQQALLNAAAQGQDVSGAAVGRIQGSHEVMGIMNGMREEINSMREALGFELEEISYDYQVGQAKIARDSALIGSALQFGAQAYGAR
jgi:hypothetical protein